MKAIVASSKTEKGLNKPSTKRTLWSKKKKKKHEWEKEYKHTRVEKEARGRTKKVDVR